jgi:hypothetical protein
MTPRQQVLAAVRKVDGCLYVEPAPGQLIGSAHTGPGLAWKATDCHTLAVNWMTDRPAGWRSLLADIELGTEPCTEPDCEQCAEGPCGEADCLICGEDDR